MFPEREQHYTLKSLGAGDFRLNVGRMKFLIARTYKPSLSDWNVYNLTVAYRPPPLTLVYNWRFSIHEVIEEVILYYEHEITPAKGQSDGSG